MIDSCSINIEDLTSNIGIDKNTVIELLDIYCREMSEEMQQIRQFQKTQNWSDLQRSIHNIKGVSANLYLHDMSIAADVLEDSIKKNIHSSIEHSIQALFHTFDETIKSINIISDGV